ncbi:hypothetical protein BU16DRAFT_565210 [Lophium mytilinum]|uniref:BTB domain-containing protein n=1 Tax=Lophium mytilinum TaxID=390894 RepID=A0A6A6QHF2_9PEZI|nr:hypothetical protein BU16DRAFT_565210 [Lophium mytilinum]
MDAIEPDSEPPGKLPETIALDNDGDVVLSPGDGNTRLLVSSKVLALASPVFRAMFTGGFAESQNLSSASPREVPLPDDNEDAMTLLCKILHFDYRAPETVYLSDLVGFATVCHKYDCAASVKPWALIWLAPLLPLVGKGGYEVLLYVTLALNLAGAFRAVTKALIFERIHPIHMRIACAGHEFLMEELAAHIEQQRLGFRQILPWTFETAIQPFVELQLTPDGRGFPCIQFIIGEYWRALRQAGLWPLIFGLNLLAFSDILQKVEQLPEITSPVCERGCFCANPATRRDEITRTLQKKIRRVGERISGLCLECWIAEREVVFTRKAPCEKGHTACREVLIVTKEH